MALVTFCLVAVLFYKQIRAMGGFPSVALSGEYSDYIYRRIFGTGKAILVLVTLPFLGLGGLLREKVRRTAGFTLTLPVTRLRLILAYLGMGLAELALLSLLPSIIVPAASRIVNQYYPFSQAFHFSVLWFICGGIVFSVAFLLSTILGGEYTAPVACIILLFLHAVASAWRPLVPYRLNLMWTMDEFHRMSWDPQHILLLSGPLPWMRLMIIALMSVALLVLAILITQKQDF
jgi:ABC-type transport system involved in multi-copper enzyme maturation permease subunit